MKVKIELFGYGLNVEPLKDTCAVNTEENESLRVYIKELTELLAIAQGKLIDEVAKNIIPPGTDNSTPDDTDNLATE